MTATLDCRQVDDSALVARYLAGKLAPDEREAFEGHYFCCDHCQSEVRLGMAIRAGLRTAERQPVLRARASLRKWIGATGLLLAASVTLLVFRRVERNAPGDVVALGKIAGAPPYVGVSVRGQVRPADSLFVAAMGDYDRHRYDSARSALQRALAAGVDPLPAEFFLGATLLLTDKPQQATAEFERVIALGESAYLSEAHYYRAKSLLRLGRVDEALDHLARAARRQDEIGPQAAALADSLREIVRRR